MKFARKNNPDVFGVVYGVLTNEDAIQSGIALEGAKIILTESSAKKAYYISLVASDERIIQDDIVLKVINIISTSSEDELSHYNENNIIDFISMKLGINISEVYAKRTPASDYIDSLICSLNGQIPKSNVRVKSLTKQNPQKK